MSTEIVPLVELPLEQACREKWASGREQYGGDTFVGHPGEEAFSEGVDLLNYLDEWERQGKEVGDLRLLVKWCTRRIQRMVLEERVVPCRTLAAGGGR